MCVFQEDGAATIALDEQPPEGCRPAWKARHGFLCALLAHPRKLMDLLSPAKGEPDGVKKLKAELSPRVGGSLLQDSVFTGEFIEDGGQACVSFNCRRVGRLSRARAFALLMAYTSCLSRPAFDRDFGKTGS